MTTSAKERHFIAEPIGEKDVLVLPGVGPIIGQRMKKAGFVKAFLVLGQFLMLNKDEALFTKWMKDQFNANTKQSGDCFKALNDWCRSFL